MDLGPSSPAASGPGPQAPEATWIGPIPDSRVLPDDGDPAELAVARETISLAFVAALQHLPPRQRTVLILREVLRWRASEVADLLGATAASVNSALERARSTLAARRPSSSDPVQPLDERQRELVARFADAFERYDIESLASLLHEDATQTMPPYEMWLHGPAEIARWMLGPGIGCRGSRLIPVEANGSPGFGQYRPTGTGGPYQPWALHVLELSGDRIIGINAFLNTTSLFPLFGLPPRLDP
jgi:RNA polymerase sigma-70 factor (ECF subfamily)